MFVHKQETEVRVMTLEDQVQKEKISKQKQKLPVKKILRGLVL